MSLSSVRRLVRFHRFNITPPMTPLLLLPKLLIAGGSSFLGTLSFPASGDVMNHTLAGEKIPASQVVCRDRWGTPMPPDGKAGYSLISPIKKSLIEQSLWIPPVSGTRPFVKAPVPPDPLLDSVPASAGAPKASGTPSK